MLGGSSLPIVAGLGVGIVFVILFSTMLKPIDIMTDDEIGRLVPLQYPQIQALKERYPSTTMESVEHFQWGTYVIYSATKEPLGNITNTFPGPRSLVITLLITPFSPISIEVSCGSGISTDLPATVQTIRTTDCLDTL